MIRWAYGVTTCPARRRDLLPRTLASLKLAGFSQPRLFVDGVANSTDMDYHEFGLEVTTRYPVIRPFGNWALAVAELFIREPRADRYAIFQDDMVTYLNLRQYLESVQYPEKGYWNLYTFPDNQRLCPKDYIGWYRANQRGLGAVGIVLSHAAVVRLFHNQNFTDRPIDEKRGWRCIDGGLVNTFNSFGWEEYVHNPSLVQHIGIASSMGNRRHPPAGSFRGEDFDALSLLVARPEITNSHTAITRQQWEAEMESLLRNRAEDQERLTQATDNKHRRRFQRLVYDYNLRIARHKKFEPPVR